MKWDEYDFIVDESSERMPSVGITGWESVIFELADDEQPLLEALGGLRAAIRSAQALVAEVRQV
jgi:hypothetical protein